MEVACIVCELVVVSCTLVHLWGLHCRPEGVEVGALEHRRRDMVLGFLSLAFTLAVLAMTAIGTDKLVRSGRTIWTYIRGNRSTILPHGGATKIYTEFNMAVGGLPVDVEGAEHEGQAMADNAGVAGVPVF